MLSAVVITRNEEKNIARCLKSLTFADEIIVVDSDSTDRTVELAENLGAKVYVHTWEGYGKQKNFGADKAINEWVLFVDADEVVTEELSQGVEALVGNNTREDGEDVYWVKIVTVFLGKPLRHLHGHNPRLFKKSKARWTDAHVHEQVAMTDGQVVKLGDDRSDLVDGFLLHYSHKSVGSYLEKMHKYTSLDAKEMAGTGKHRSGRDVARSPLLPYKLAMRQLVKLLFYRKGVLDGLAGVVWCFLSAYYEFEMGRKFVRNIEIKKYRN